MSGFLRNAWYAAGWASELAAGARVGRVLLNEPVLLYRAEDGSPAAIGNRCPHRFAPLNMGKRFGDQIACPYHGLRFDRTGACVHNPHGDGRIPPRARVPAYPVIEKGPLLWIWMGEPAAADPAGIPDFDFMTSPDHLVDIGGSLRMDCHYELIVDNLMDLSHAVFLHESNIGTPDTLRGELRVEEGERWVSGEIWTPNCTPVGACLPIAGPGNPVDHWLRMEWHAPSNLVMYLGCTPKGRPRPEGFESGAIHMITPETDTSAHYFFANAMPAAFREFLPPPDPSGISQKSVFENEDGVMLKAVQKMMGTTDLWSLNPVFLAGDGAAIRVRRTLQRLIEEETGALTPA